MRNLLLFGLFVIGASLEPKEVDLKHLKCLVCRAAMKELEKEVIKHNPNKLVYVANFRMDAEGNTEHKKIPLGRSATHIEVLLDIICDNFEDYVRARRKSDNKLTILNLMSPLGGMNPMMSKVDIIQDDDLNKSLQHYCNAIVGEFEEDIVSLYVDGIENKETELCTSISRICENYAEDDADSDNADRLNDIYFDVGRDEL